MAAEGTFSTECGICLDELDEPRLLPCLHTFCTRCLESLDQKESCFTCPVCRRVVSVDSRGIEGLPLNHLVVDALKLHRAERSGRADCGLCDESHAAQHFCKQCTQFLCEEQASIHRKTKATKLHTLEPVSLHARLSKEEDDGGSKSTDMSFRILRSKVTCERHIGAALEFFCEDCRVVICPHCALADHKFDKTVYVSDALPEHKTAIMETVAATRARLPLLRTACSAVDAAITAVLTQSSQVNQAIDEAGRQLIQQVIERQQLLRKELQGIVDAKYKTLELQRERLTGLESHFSTSCEFASTIVSVGTPVEVLQLRRLVEQRLNELSMTPISLVPEENNRFKAVFSSSAHDIIGNFGEIIIDAAYGPQCIVYGDGVQRAHIGRRRNYFTIIAKDRRGDRRTTGGDAIWVYLQPVQPISPSAAAGGARLSHALRRVASSAAIGPSIQVTPEAETEKVVESEASLVMISDKQNGTYDCQYEIHEAVQYTLVVQVNGQPAEGSPFLVSIARERDLRDVGRAVLSFGGPDVLQYAYGVTTGPQGELIVADYGHRLQVFSPTGKFLQTLAQGQLRNPHGIILLPDKTLLVADGGNKELKQLSMDGSIIQVIPCDFPFGVAVLRSGDFVATEYASHRVKIFSSQGQLIRTLGTGRAGSELNQFNHPTGVAVTPAGDLVVLDCDNHRVVVINPQDGQVIRQFGGLGTEPGQLRHPNFVAISQSGLILITDRVNNRVQVFTIEGVFVHMFDGLTGTAGPNPHPMPQVAGGQFNQPVGICITADERIVVTEYGSRRVQVF